MSSLSSVSVLKADVGGEEPVDGWASDGVHRLVGNGSVTSESCGKFRGFSGCLRADLHNKVSVLGEDFRNKAFVQVIHFSCDKPSCPECFKSGWAVREAGKIEGRLTEASNRFGLVEHIVASPSVKDWGLSFPSLRKRVVEILYNRGVVGGCLIYHHFRYSVERLWYRSPHFHVLGFLADGYGHCRSCERSRLDCIKCNGFEGQTRREFLNDHFIVKVLGKRETVFGTSWYQLNHASYMTDAKRASIAVWWGVCSYRKMKVPVVKRKNLCPICSEDLVLLHHLGVRYVVKDRSACGYVRSFLDDLCDVDGSPNWCEAVGGSRYE